MKLEKIAQIVIGLFVVLSVVVFAWRHLAVSGQISAQSPADSQFVVYYFHSSARCVTCQTIESYTREAIMTKYAKELKDKVLSFESLNAESSENRHYISKFSLTSLSVVLAEFENGQLKQFKKLDELWKLLSSRDQFIAHVQSELDAVLRSRS